VLRGVYIAYGVEVYVDIERGNERSVDVSIESKEKGDGLDLETDQRLVKDVHRLV
jgi:hypothetical protein